MDDWYLEPEISLDLFKPVAAQFARGWSKDEVFLDLVARGFDATAAAEFVDYVAKAAGTRPRRLSVLRRAVGRLAAP
jgi:hypothetical protein